MSAKTGEGLTRLANTVSDALSHNFQDVDVELDVSNGRLLSYLAKNGEVHSRTYADDRVSVHCRLAAKFLGRIPRDEAIVTHRHNGAVTSSAADDADQHQLPDTEVA